jgi:non-ribosomal peptide synthetase component F
VLAPARELSDPRILNELICARGVTTLAAVPSVLDILTREGALGGSLRRVVSSGEELGCGLHDRLFSGPAPNLRNFYGQTEVTIDAAFWQCRAGDTSRRIPVGHAIDGAELLILDEQLRPLPDGMIGQIFFAGGNLSRGYRGQPRATAERFLPHPFATGQRMFRTGDIGRLRHDNALILIGRDDDQIKLRGVRVEPGEIESLLVEHPSIREAAVVPIAIDDAATSSDPTGLDHDGLRVWLGRLLPENLELLERLVDEH